MLGLLCVSSLKALVVIVAADVVPDFFSIIIFYSLNNYVIGDCSVFILPLVLGDVLSRLLFLHEWTNRVQNKSRRR